MLEIILALSFGLICAGGFLAMIIIPVVTYEKSHKEKKEGKAE